MKRLHSGFTLVELLTVIAIVGILAALLLASVQRAKSLAFRATCLSNKKQLSIAWAIYADENNGAVVPNVNLGLARGTPATELEVLNYGRALNWAFGQLNWGVTTSDSTNLAYLLDARFALLGTQVKNWRLYKCPADRYLSSVQKQAGWRERVRSVAMNQYIGGAYYGAAPGYNAQGLIDSPWDAPIGWSWYSRENQFVKLSPSDAWLFMDEHPDFVGPIFFNVDHVPGMFLPASYHEGAAVMNFVDGHAAYKKWMYPATKAPVEYIEGNRAELVNAASDKSADWNWVFSHATAGR